MAKRRRMTPKRRAQIKRWQAASRKHHRGIAVGAAVAGIGILGAGSVVAMYGHKVVTGGPKSVTQYKPPQANFKNRRLGISPTAVPPGRIVDRMTGNVYKRGAPFLLVYRNSTMKTHISNELVNGTRGLQRPAFEYIKGKKVKRGPVPKSVSDYYKKNNSFMYQRMRPDTVAYNQVKERFISSRSFRELDPKTLKPITGQKLQGIGF